MRTELPVFKRCCFCFPLRYGLITWGYLKLSAAIVVSIALTITLINAINIVVRHKSPFFIYHLVIVSIVLALLLTDIAFNTVFVIGGHTKNLALLRVYYIYNIVLWALTITLVLIMCVLMAPNAVLDRDSSYRAWLLLLDLASSFVNIIIQSYFLLLLRSEIIKLRSNCEFRFVNNAAEAECTMKCKEELLYGKKEMEDVCEKGASEREDVCGKSCQIKGACQKNEDREVS